MSKDAARDNSPARRELHEATEGDTNQQSTDSLRGEYLEVKEKGRVEKPQVEKPAAPEKERDGSLSINGVPRNLKLSDEEAGTLVAILKGKRIGRNVSETKPENHGEPARTLEEKELQAAAKLVTDYESRLEKEVIDPMTQTLFDGLDHLERNMPGEKLAKLELARMRFQENIELEAEMKLGVEAKGLLLYIAPTQRPQVMKDFDVKADQIVKTLIDGAVPKIKQIQKESPGLSEAYDLLFRKLGQEEKEREKKRRPTLEV